MNQKEKKQKLVVAIPATFLHVLLIAAAVVAAFYGLMVLAQHHAQRLTRPDKKGQITLLARHAIRDGDLTCQPQTLEEQTENFENLYGRHLENERNTRYLASWDTLDKNASWLFLIPRQKKYTVQIDYACDADAAAGRFLLCLPGWNQEIQTVDTGGWDQYRTIAAGPVSIPPGRQALQLVPLDIPQTNLMRLRQVRLIPVPAR